MNKIYDLIIIGGGAAGMFCAASHNEKGNKIILESGKCLGTKMLMSGSGQCNVTHSGNIKDFPICYGDAGKKIRGCLFKYSNTHLCDFLKSIDVDTVCREDGKIFPSTMDAHTIVDALTKKALENGFDIKESCKVVSLKRNNNLFSINVANGGDFTARNVVIATGGCSYPTTGSDGSMFEILERDLGVQIVKPRPSLVPIKISDYHFTQLSGISFEKTEVVVAENTGKKIASLEGPLLFTHSEFSGPVILDISKYAEPGKRLIINYVNKPLDQVRNKLNEVIKSSHSSLDNIICQSFNVPKRFATAIVENVGIKTIDIAKALTCDTYLISGTSGFSKAMATAGGISLNQVNLKTMEFSDVPGLYAIGESLDIDGRTGGYNLQFAYSSAMSVSLK